MGKPTLMEPLTAQEEWIRKLLAERRKLMDACKVAHSVLKTFRETGVAYAPKAESRLADAINAVEPNSVEDALGS